MQGGKLDLMARIIRAAGAADRDLVVRVIKAVYDEYGFGWHPETYHRDLYDLDGYYWAQGDEFFVSEEGGTVALELFDRIPAGVVEPMVRIEGCDCSLERLYVHPEARGIGLGRDLMAHAIIRARELGRTKMEIWSDKLFADAHRLYEKFGARVVSDRLCDDPEQSPEYGLELVLAEARLP